MGQLEGQFHHSAGGSNGYFLFGFDSGAGGIGLVSVWYHQFSGELVGLADLQVPVADLIGQGVGVISALNQVDIAIASFAFQLGSNLRLIGGLVFVGGLYGYRGFRI